MVDNSWSPTRHRGGPLLIVIGELTTRELGTHVLSWLQLTVLLKNRGLHLRPNVEVCPSPVVCREAVLYCRECSQACRGLGLHHDAS